LEGSSCQEEAARLLPWYVVGRLSAADTERVSQHLERCAICRSDLKHETAVRAQLTADASLEYAPQAGLAKTLSRIDELGRDVRSPAPRIAAAAARPRRSGTIRWLTAAVVIQALTLGWVGLSATRRMQDSAMARYETLSSDRPIPAGPHIRAVFAPNMTMAELRALLAANHLIVVSGPSESGVFTLKADASAADLPATALAALRRDVQVLFAEPAVNDATVLP
jgi:anti-sigma factor RsiW